MAMGKKLEQFEKWWKKNGHYFDCIDSPANYDAKVTAKIVWKAALEWVLEREIELKPDEWDFIDVCNAIKKELGNDD